MQQNLTRTKPSVWLDRMATGMGYFIGLLLLAMVAIMFASVVWRYALSAPIVWADQLCRWLFVWMTYLGIAVAYRKGIHIGVDVVVRKLPRALRLVVATIVDLAVGAFLIIVMIKGYGITIRSFDQVYGALELPPSYMYAAAPVSCALMLVFMLDALRIRIARFLPEAKVEEGTC